MPFKPSGASLVDVARETQDTGFGPGQAAAGGVTSVTAADATVVIAGGAATPTVGVGAVPEAKVTGLVADLAAKLVKANNLSDLTDAAAARTALGLGTAATHATGDYDAAGAAAAVAAAARLQRGTYAAGTAYAVGDLVFYQGALYVCIQAGTGHTPSTSPLFWTALAGDAGWTNVVLTNAFTGTARYRMDALGFVHLSGYVAPPGGASSGVSPFTLPAGYRPDVARRFANGDYFQNAATFSEPIWINIAATGVATYIDSPGTGHAAGIDGVSFLAEN